MTYWKGKDNVLADSLTLVSPLELESEDRDSFGIISVEHITSEIPTKGSLLHTVRMATQAEPVLSQLRHQIFQGWPDVRRGILETIYPFWNYNDELFVEDELNVKTHKLVIPTSQQQEFLKDLHYGHLGNKKTLL